MINTIMENGWCKICSCFFTNYSQHVQGKRHFRKIKEYERLYHKLPDMLKFRVISFLYPSVHDYRSFHKQIHQWKMKTCTSLVVSCNPYYTQCQRCYLPRDGLDYDDFLYLLKNNFVCLNCMYNVVSTTTYLTNINLVVYGDCVQMCSIDTYQNIHPFYRFDRIRSMMEELKRIQYRNNYQTSCFDLTQLSSFANVFDFLRYMYQLSFNSIYVTEMFLSSL